ncbi:hypothetical protein G6F32_016530 [Rhizopus arrhizus]|uniref:Uncharacterized protein n=1 Tax=Rhizopus delemar TaxID=936053 RepID=A0A9P6XRA5_9FUNG|nr:hypothetical protein G6F32_016530 [Rhizopus arrhizus]KAG1530884.1 hypothetical protein G6F50_017030 [Rhizopus delemar]
MSMTMPPALVTTPAPVPALSNSRFRAALAAASCVFPFNASRPAVNGSHRPAAAQIGGDLATIALRQCRLGQIKAIVLDPSQIGGIILGK